MNRELKLKRPLAILDLETTGTVPNLDRIVNAGMKPIDFVGFRWIGLVTNLNWLAAVFSVSIPIIDS